VSVLLVLTLAFGILVAVYGYLFPRLTALLLLSTWLGYESFRFIGSGYSLLLGYLVGLLVFISAAIISFMIHRHSLSIYGGYHLNYLLFSTTINKALNIDPRLPLATLTFTLVFSMLLYIVFNRSETLGICILGSLVFAVGLSWIFPSTLALITALPILFLSIYRNLNTIKVQLAQ